jgi:hypothetical protein
MRCQGGFESVPAPRPGGDWAGAAAEIAMTVIVIEIARRGKGWAAALVFMIESPGMTRNRAPDAMRDRRDLAAY